MAAQEQAIRPRERGIVAGEGGVRIAWEVHGSGPATLLLMPTWTIVHSRFWKGQIGYLARHFRVVTFDGRGNGRSDRPRGAAAYEDARCAADALAVLDATGTDRAVVVGLSWGVTWSLHLAAEHPERVLGLVGIGAAFPVREAHPQRNAHLFEQRRDDPRGWEKWNGHHWLGGGYRDFLEFFFREMFTEPHSTKQIEDCIGWGLETDAETLVASTAAQRGWDGSSSVPIEPVCERVRCPVLLVHGTADLIRPASGSRHLAELTGGRLVLLEGSGHGPMSRDPVRVNHLIRDFVESVTAAAGSWVDAEVPAAAGGEHTACRPGERGAVWTRAARRPRRVLYLSSPIGLGHARRDLAIVEALRKHHPDLEVQWLAQHPVTALLERAGERVHPASAWLASESRHIESEAGEHDLHAFQAIRRMDEVLVHNFMVFDDVVREEQFDLVVGDEAWDVDHHLHENPELKRFAFAWMTDFVGWLPMPDGGEAEAALTADYNAEMIEQRARYHRVRDRSVFVGNADDIVPSSFGPGLPDIRQWTEENFEFAGYITGFDATEVLDRSRLRRELRWDADEPWCVVTVGGSGVGTSLLRRVLDAVPLARRQADGLRFLVVAGPRIDPASLPRRRGATVRGLVPGLYRQLAAADVAVVQGGLTTCMELTAARRPFVYVPLRRHFEQNLHVRHRLERYRAGRCVPYDEAVDPDALAAALVGELGRPVDYRPVETDGAERAAAMLGELL